MYHKLIHLFGFQISICSMIGGLSVVCTSGLGASILTSINGNNQFTYWFIYFILVFGAHSFFLQYRAEQHANFGTFAVVVTLLTEINFLNKALELFNTAMVTPIYFVLFTGCSESSLSYYRQLADDGQNADNPPCLLFSTHFRCDPEQRLQCASCENSHDGIWLLRHLLRNHTATNEQD